MSTKYLQIRLSSSLKFHRNTKHETCRSLPEIPNAGIHGVWRKWNFDMAKTKLPMRYVELFVEAENKVAMNLYKTRLIHIQINSIHVMNTTWLGFALSAEQSDYNANTEYCVLCLCCVYTVNENVFERVRKKVASTKMIGHCCLLSR